MSVLPHNGINPRVTRLLRGGSWFSNQPSYLNMQLDTAAGVPTQFTGFRTFRPSRMTRP